MASQSQAFKKRAALAREAREAREAQHELIPLPPSIVPRIDDDQRFTTRETLEWAKRVCGVDAFDLDVAACEESRHAPIWFGTEQNGLARPWSGRVWCNPPYSDIEPWLRKAWAEFPRCELIAMLLPACRCEQRWWQEHVEPLRDGRSEHGLRTYFLPGRSRFGIPGNPLGIGVGAPPFGCVLLVWHRS